MNKLTVPIRRLRSVFSSASGRSKNICRTLSLLFFFVTISSPVFSQSGQIQLETVARTFETISQSNAYADNLTSASQNVLPVGIRRVQDNMEVIIAVDKAVFHPGYTELSVFAKATLPQKTAEGRETTLFFGTRGIKLSYDGSIIGDASLTLLEDISIPFNNGNMSLTLLGNYDSNTGRTSSGTYMTIDCFGFKELGLDVEVRFPETLIEKVDPAGNVNENDKVVSGHFQTVVQNWNDLLVGITLPSFQICGMEGFVFNLQGVTLDFSDTSNGEALVFPAGYEQKYSIPGAATLWRGVYARRLEITLPEAFNDGNNVPTRFMADNMLIDDNGITGLFAAENILSFESGNASGWNFSVNTFNVELEANKLIAAGFAGEIGLPFEGDQSRLNYDALIRENNEYLMSVSPVDSLDFSIFSAKATILPNSYVELHVVDGRFRPEALLHGEMSVATKSDVAVNIPRLHFRSLHLLTVDPYIEIESLGYDGKVSIGRSSAFGISLDKILLKSTKGGRVELASGVDVTLADGMFSGQTRIALLASLQDENGKHKWRSDGVRLDAISIKAEIAETISLAGSIEWRRDDPVYGEGFGGELAVGVKPINLTVNMRGAFGAVDNFKYWFVDGSIDLPGVGIPVMGPLAISGFAGAVSQRMIGTGGTNPNSASAFSSAQYVPDKSMGLGLKASVMLKVGEVANGEACFDIAFSSSGGLNYIGFYGFAEFTADKLAERAGLGGITEKYQNILKKEQEYASNMKLLSDLKQFEPNKAAAIVSPIPSNLSAGLRGTIGIQYDFRNRSFHASTELFFNTPGGFLKGDGPNGLAGWGVLHIAPDEWYMHLGSPDKRIGIALSLGNIINIRTGAYLMAGSRIPDMPAPPRQVADILGMQLSQLSLGRNIDALSTGKGFAFGADFGVKTGDITFLILYANFAAGLGFDIMLKDYGQMVCADTGRRIGINGWYAMGQSYAYLQGELGVKINLWFLKTKFPIIKGSAATLMQAGLPSPSYFRGYLGVNFNLLGGLVSGNMRFKLSLGDDCTPVIPGGSPLQMAMISDLAPTDSETNVNVFSVPQATFTTAIDQPFVAQDENGEDNTYKITLKSFTLQTEDGRQIAGESKLNREKNAVTFQAKEVLPSNARLRTRVEVGFERYSGGRWSTVVTGGKEAIESRESLFTTGQAPDYIPLNNILHSYPVVDQQYFLTRESSKGYVQLQFGQKELFERGYNYRLVLTGSDHRKVTVPFTYNESANRIEYSIPQLTNMRGYTLQVSYTPQATGSSPTTGIGHAQQVLDDDEGGSVTVSSRVATVGVMTDVEKVILDYGFATSRWSTFPDKIRSIEMVTPKAQDARLSYRFLYDVRMSEPFEEAEVAGVTHSGGQALIRAVAGLTEPFFAEVVFPMNYNGYPFGGIRLRDRDEQEIGVPPIRSVFLYQPYLNSISGGSRPQQFTFPFSYDSSIIAEQDYRDLMPQILNNRSRVPAAVYSRFLNNRLPFIRKGRYKITLQYVLPDGTATSSSDFYFENIY